MATYVTMSDNTSPLSSIIKDKTFVGTIKPATDKENNEIYAKEGAFQKYSLSYFKRVTNAIGFSSDKLIYLDLWGSPGIVQDLENGLKVNVSVSDCSVRTIIQVDEETNKEYKSLRLIMDNEKSITEYVEETVSNKALVPDAEEVF